MKSMNLSKTGAVVLCVVFTVFSAGCASNPKRLYTPDGKEGYNVGCSGNALDWGICYERAGAVCGPRGYMIVDKFQEQGGTSAVVSGEHGAIASSTIKRNMVIQCKDALPAAAAAKNSIW